ncbi:MAG: hypothetical protein EBV49_16460, partial [Betaproteobacteria bacterium]|nr:hypothetical protein [Betaproteobacteria bacterium]
MVSIDFSRFDVIVVNQPLGLGDIIFVQSILDYFVSNGKKVIFPISRIYYKAVLRHMRSPGVHYVEEETLFPMKEFFNRKDFVLRERNLYVPLTWSYVHFPKAPVAVSKYLLLGLPIMDWRTSVSITRDLNREAGLIQELGVPSGNFRLINRYYGSPPNYTEADIRLSDADKQADLEINPLKCFSFETSPFDYIGVILAAKEIHFVESVMCYFVDLFCSQSRMSLHC